MIKTIAKMTSSYIIILLELSSLFLVALTETNNTQAKVFPEYLSTRNVSPPKIVCYFTSWSVYRPDPWKYKVENIPKNVCTHILYSFAGLDNSTYKIKSLGPTSGQGSYSDFMRLRELSPKSKLMLSIGGWNEFGRKYSRMVNDPSKRQIFVNSVVKTFNKYKFDGFDLDWEYPGAIDRGGKKSDKENFLKLVQELRNAFDVSLGQERGHIEITGAVPVTEDQIDDGFAVKELCQILDAIHMMAYDLRGYWDKNVDVHTPLYARPFDMHNSYQNVNVENAGELWNSKGCPRHKLVLGIAFYGRTFTLDKPEVHGLNAAANKVRVRGNPAPYTNETGYMAYFEICQKLQDKSLDKPWIQEWDKIGKVPYTYRADQWIGYENSRSINIKMDFMKSRRYGGVMFWAIDLDDYLGLCNNTSNTITLRHVLLDTIVKSLVNYNIPADSNI